MDRYVREVDDLRRHCDRLSLACQAMWELVRETTDLTEEDLEERILEIDGRDGEVDGEIGMQRLLCPSCGRPTNSKRDTCVMCGAPVDRPYKFEG